MKIAILIVAILAIVPVVGALLPKAHVASKSIVLPRSPQEVYSVIRAVERAPEWRSEVTRVEVLSANRFREHGKHGAVTYDIVEDEPARRFVTRIADTNLGYSGSWTYAIEPLPQGTRLTITENGIVTNVIFRFMSRFVFGHTATIERYLSALQRRLVA